MRFGLISWGFLMVVNMISEISPAFAAPMPHVPGQLRQRATTTGRLRRRHMGATVGVHHHHRRHRHCEAPHGGAGRSGSLGALLCVTVWTQAVESPLKNPSQRKEAVEIRVWLRPLPSPRGHLLFSPVGGMYSALPSGSPSVSRSSRGLPRRTT